MDKYASFQQLKDAESNYSTTCENRKTIIAVYAPHGGRIDLGSSEIAEEIARGDFSIYHFQGKKSRGNKDLHLASEKFDEPEALQLAEETEIILAIHSCDSQSDKIYIGGLHDALRGEIDKALKSSGFQTILAPPDALAGRHPNNICNRGRSGEGVQLEICKGLRSKMFGDLNTREGRKIKYDIFFQFCEAINSVLKHYT
ncbi:MAG: poly-gamma-glutamate hydrolase family protein [Deltaproteobacteria bacterium]